MKKEKWLLLTCILLLLAAVYYRSQFSDLLDDVSQQLKAETSTNIDWEALQKRNPDISAWLCVPGTPIDYPVVQSRTKEEGYYLTHDIDKEETIYGAIYTEAVNKEDFTDPLTVVYGHNMRDGSMFGSLKNFTKPDFFQEQDTILVYLPGGELRTYQIVAAYRYPADHLLSTFDFHTPKGAENYFQKVRGFAEESGGNYREDLFLEAPAITLSTCTANDGSHRYLVQGVLKETSLYQQLRRVIKQWRTICRMQKKKSMYWACCLPASYCWGPEERFCSRMSWNSGAMTGRSVFSIQSWEWSPGRQVWQASCTYL